jgi:uncharacterized protein
LARGIRVSVSEEGAKLLRSRGSWTLVTGFPGFGYVGTIAVRYLVKKLNAVKVGNVFTRYMPDFTALDDYGMVTPFEIFVHADSGTIYLLNSVVPYTPERQSFVEAVVDWFTSVGGSRAILRGGLNSRFRVGSEELSWLCLNNCGWSLEEPQLPKGLYIVGPLALLTMVLDSRRIPTLIILPYTDPGKYDPRAASVAVDRISRLLELRVDVTELLEHYKLIEEAEEKLKEAIKESESKVRMHI